MRAKRIEIYQDDELDQCQSQLELPPNVHIMMPLKFPNEQQLRNAIDSLRNLSDSTFGHIFIHFGLDGEDADTFNALQSYAYWLGEQNHAWFIHRLYKQPQGSTSMVINHVFDNIVEDGYFMYFNDDAVMLSPNWNRLAIEALRRPPLCNYGLAWIGDSIGQGEWIEHPFVSSHHRDVFHYLFPFHFKNYCNDVWMTRMYKEDNACNRPSLIKQTGALLHHSHSGSKYLQNAASWDNGGNEMTTVIKEAQAVLCNYLKYNRVV